ncbi:4-hydroxythreonine-4-phosphate dehydrogenase PdxA, partial [bacterium]
MRPRIALTSGEPAGIGPDLCVALAARAALGELDCDIRCLIDRDLLAARAAALGRPAPESEAFQVDHLPLAAPVVPGRLDAANSRYVLDLLDRAIDGCVRGDYDGMVTAPLQKSIFNDIGLPFSGHTEYLAERVGVARPVMMLVCEAMRVALVTTHLPLSQVPSAVTREAVLETLRILSTDLARLYAIERPRIAVCGLNPHAGENGHLGHEDRDCIAPAIAAARGEGIDCFGPLPADTLFVPRLLEGCHAALAMYHDQG